MGPFAQRLAAILVGVTLLVAAWCGTACAQDAPVLRGEEPAAASPETVVVTAPKDDTDYRLGPGDKLRVTVFGEDDLSGEFQIDGTGFLRFPLVGQIKAAGLTAHELEGQIEAALDRGYLNEARVAVEVSSYRPFYIIGQVNKPGEYAYVSNITAVDAIALAGGYTEKAVESTLYIRHEGESDEEAIDSSDLVRIRPGDVVRVPETAFWSVADILSPITGAGYLIATIKP